MSKQATFKVDKRSVIGKKVSQLRRAGVVPAVVYGAEMEPQSVQAETRVMERALLEIGLNAPLQLEIDGKKHLAIIKKIDRDPVKGALRHVDFQTVSATDKIDARVQIVLVGEGESEAERNGWIVMQVLNEVEVRAVPSNMVRELEVDIRSLAEVGDRLTLEDINLPEGVEFTDHEIDLSTAVVNVYDPAELEAANEAAGGDAEDIDDVEVEKGGDEDGGAGEGEESGEAKEGADDSKSE